MARGRTLWEMLIEAFSGPVEMQFYNPLKARIGHAVSIDLVEWRDLNFFLHEIREYRRTIGGQKFFFADYEILARPLGGEDVRLRLRLFPVEDVNRNAGLSHQVLMLNLFEEMGYNRELHDVLKDQTGRFQVLQDGVVQEEYWRINDVKTSYKAQVAVLRDLDQDQRLEKHEVRKIGLEYWDFWRETRDEIGEKLTQYLFVEMDTDTGWFQMWRGPEIDPQKVLVL